MDPLLTASATGLAARIRKREIRSADVVEAHIAWIERVNPRINAVVSERFEAARAEAHEADRRVDSEPAETLPPLLGVPCTIKESFALEGMPNSAGLVARKHVTADRDAVTVSRLRAAGAIPLGVTNVSELCMWMESSNKVYGRSNNPYDARRIVGGSSGGEGAIIGAGGSPFGLGADIGGSIRMPAFFNGVFGHKPSPGVVPNSGQYPMSENEAMRLLCTGPLCRRAEDLMPLLRILAGPDGEDPECCALPLGDPEAVDFTRLTVVQVEDNGAVPVSADLRGAQHRVAEALRRRGAKVMPMRFSRLARSLELWSAKMSAAAETSYATLLGDGRAVRALPEFIRWLLRRSPYTLPSIGLVALERLAKLLPGRVDRMLAELEALKRELDLAIGDGVLLYPSYSQPAPRHHRPLLPPVRWQYTSIVNALELPSTQVPLGLNAEGLPLGVQVVGRHGQDHLTIGVAMELECAFGGWIPPPPAT